MRVSIFGLGYAGFIHAVGLAYLGHRVVGFDVDLYKVDSIRRGVSPIYEPGVEDLLRRARGELRVTGDPEEAVALTDITIIAVGTPSSREGPVDLTYVEEAIDMVGKAIRAKGGRHIVVIKSTVPPGTTLNMKKRLENMGLRYAIDFDIAFNPEFLREGSAVEDFLKPDRIVVGALNREIGETVMSLYDGIEAPKIITDPTTAEFVKYVSNVFLALKISFSNEVGDICKAMGVDSYEVFRIVGMDKRIGPHFFRSGLGFGGSCFPKDLKAWIAFAETLGLRVRIARAALEVNMERPMKAIGLLEKHLGDLRGRRIGVLGLSFKPNTDDIRESRGIEVAILLIDRGAKVYVHDPAALEKSKKILKDRVIYMNDPQKLLEETEAVIIATEWPQYSQLDYRGKIVVDGRRVEKAREAKIYEGMTW